MRLVQFALVLFLMPTAVWAGNAALVIGNSDYRTVPTLPNPANDARVVSEALSKQGFDVTVALNQTRAQMLTTLREFRDQADQAEYAMVYYAGHGMEIAGRNYLIPVDARIADERDARLEMVEMQDVLAQLSGAKRMKMIVLDACRDNPFVTRMQREKKARNVGRGLAIVSSADADTLIAYAAAAGEVTPDGQEGANSPYTRAFVNALSGPPVDIRLMLGAVRDELRQSVPGSAPFVYSSLGGSAYVVNPNNNARFAAKPNQPPELDENALLLDFATAEISNSVASWDRFLSEYESHTEHTLYVLARRKRNLLSAANEQEPKSEPRSGAAPEQPEQVAALEVPSMPAPPADEIVETPVPTRKETIEELQRALKDRNCYPGRLDGIYGRQTASGLASLSRRSGKSLTMDRASTVDHLQQLVLQVQDLGDVRCPTAKVARTSPPRKQTTRKPATSTPKVVTSPSPTPAPQPKSSETSHSVFKNPPNYCPQFGSSPGCRDGTRISD